MNYQVWKRAFDSCVALLALLLSSPLMIVVATLIWITMGEPVFFRQLRPGYRGQPFMLLKLRTMKDVRGADGHLLPDHQRLTAIGHFCRKLSLDELPQLWNVLKGEMSIVGPRPLLMEYLSRYTPRQARRHEVLPGITGWAQVNGRQDIPFSRRLELDVWYVDHVSCRLDLKIIAMTIARLFGTGVRPGQNVAEVDDLGLCTGASQAKLDGNSHD